MNWSHATRMSRKRRPAPAPEEAGEMRPFMAKGYRGNRIVTKRIFATSHMDAGRRAVSHHAFNGLMGVTVDEDLAEQLVDA